MCKVLILDRENEPKDRTDAKKLFEVLGSFEFIYGMEVYLL
jgi:hypothetical protein